MDPPTSRKSKMRQPPESEWNENKSKIQELYIKANLPLPQVIEEMKSRHGFVASQKMYKDRFKIWKWSKNLPHKKATWMLRRLNERKPNTTIFTYGNQEWTEDRIKQAYERYGRKGPQDEPSPYGPTPSDIEYRVVASIHVSSPSDPRNLSRNKGKQPETLVQPGKHAFDEYPLDDNLGQMTLSEIRTLLLSAATAESKGDTHIAEIEFRRAVLGFLHQLSPTHEETLRAGYQFAAFYARNDKMDDADRVLDWMTAQHEKRWGPKHEKRLLHYFRTVELLNSWSRAEHAEILIYRIIDNTEGLNDESKALIARCRGRNILDHDRRSMNAVAIEQLAQQIQDPSAIDHQLRMGDLLLAGNIQGSETILLTLIEQCDRDTNNLKTQGIQARCALAKVYVGDGRMNEAQSVLQHARHLFSHFLTPSNPFPQSVALAGRRLAFMFSEVENDRECQKLLDELVAIQRSRLGLEKDKEKEKENARFLIDFLISIASDYYRVSSWDRCRPWIEQALFISMRAIGRQSQDTKRLERMLDEGNFELSSLDSVHDLMKSTKALFRF
ncbi:hypothetical protein DL765_010065 [Monosporascus sp. GIB2]|nr:hypothetical protein DL765_010065 [Monosporascus sp. GIB2]